VHVIAARIPLQGVLAVVRRAKKDLPNDLRAAGTLNAIFDTRSNEVGKPVFEGSGRTSEFHLISENSKTDLPVDVIPFSLVSGQQHAGKRVYARQDIAALAAPNEPHLTIGPFSVKLGRPSPALIQGWIARGGYQISVKGDAEIRRLTQVARAAGIPAMRSSAIGAAKLDLQVAGSWPGFPSPAITGTAEIHGVQAEIRGLNGPLKISSARVALNDAEARIEGISATVAGTRWTGSLSIPRRCAAPCPVKLDLRADEISTDQWNDLLNPNPPERPWYRFATTSSAEGQSFLAEIRATGTVAADRVVIQNLQLDRVTAKMDLDGGRLRLSDLRADVFGGKHRGDWRLDFTAKPPLYSGSGTFDSAALNQVADAMHEAWISGTASAEYRIELTGLSSAELMDSAQGDLRFNMRDGIFPHVLVSSVPLQVRRFNGTVTIQKGEVELEQATLESPTASYAVTGKASTNRKLDFKLVPEGSTGMTVTGTLAEPRVTAIRHPETQAALKR
jgi:hypothetical protein